MDSITFLGTAGARFAVARQIRSSGGIWLTLDNTNILLDPGPGSLVRCLSHTPLLNPLDLDAIILSHRHIDHSNDVNIMIEAMTDGGYAQKGTLFAPSDALDTDPVVLHHFRNHINQIVTLKEKETYSIGPVQFSTPVTHIHDVETYGLRFQSKKHTVSYITDTQYFPGLESYYKSEVVIINVVLMESKKFINHLSINDVEHMIQKIKPKLTILTHFGLGMIKSKPEELARTLSQKTTLPVIAASDEMTLSLDTISTETH